jgi:hypothetical protein
MKKILSFAVMAFMLTFAASMSATSTYSFSFNVGGNQGSGLLDTALVGNQVWVNGGTVSITAGSAVGTYSVLPGGPAPFTSPSGAFFTDNVLYPSPADPVFDTNGLLLGAGSTEINIWGNGPANYSFWAYSLSAGYFVSYDGEGTASAVPEPSTLALLGSSILGLTGVLRRKLIL